jgi:hypothetical protein
MISSTFVFIISNLSPEENDFLNSPGKQKQHSASSATPCGLQVSADWALDSARKRELLLARKCRFVMLRKMSK